MPKRLINKNGKKQKSKSEDQNEETKKKQKKTSDGKLVSMKGNLKMTLSSIPLRQHREKKSGRPPGIKRLNGKDMPGKLKSYRKSLDPCDNSNDSGLGFDHHTDTRQSMGIADRLGWISSETKRQKVDVKVENENDNDGYSFPETLRASKENATLVRSTSSESTPYLGLSNNQHSNSAKVTQRNIPVVARQSVTPPVTLTAQLSANSRFSGATLTILKQPEQQHRARYQTEGSRGAVKDREGNGFPIVQLNGYYKPATLQVFIGTDVGKVSPHMFYQACKVSGKNSTPCIEAKIDGTCVIELQLDPLKDMSATCDCVGILKERNVDVEHRFPEQLGNRSKKKSTRCRMIFRANILHEDGRQETLQVCSQPIICTQPPGVPEICKKSLTSCPAGGGLELFVLGKNFSKDTKVLFQQVDDERLIIWEQACIPDKEYLQQTHFVCVVPPYRRPNITEPVSVRLFVVASGKTSESHQFVYTPQNGAVPSVNPDAATQQPPQFFNSMLWSASLSKREQDLNIMPPPETNMVPSSSRRPSLSLPQTTEVHSPPLQGLKQEYFDDNSQSSVMDSSDICQNRYRHISESSLDVHHGDSNASMINDNSMDIGHQNISSDLLHHDNSNISMNENSIDVMIKRRSVSSMQDNSMDVSISNSNMTVLNDESSCGSVMHCSVPNLLIGQQKMLSPPQLSNEAEDLKVIDLRMKMPMATVADLASTGAPSMATLQNFCVTDNTGGPLPAQSAQSVENFLTNIESKTTSTNPFDSLSFKDRMTASILSTQSSTSNNLLNNTNERLGRLTEPVFVNSEQSLLMETNRTNIMTKTDNLGNQNKPSMLGTPFNTERLDDFLNSAANHIMPDSRSEQMKFMNKISMVSNDNQQNMIPQHSPLMVQSIPTLSHQIMAPSNSTPNCVSSTVSSGVILNSEVSQNLMCQNSPCSSSINANLMSTSLSPQGVLLQSSQTNSPHSLNNLSPNNISPPLSLGAPENAVLLEAAADLYQTQKRISQLECLNHETKEPILNKIYMNNFLAITNGAENNSNISTNQSSDNFSSLSRENNDKSDFIIPVSVKEIGNSSTTITTDKKIEDRMIPQSFTSLTENELINFINPSCFDQV